MLQNIFGKIPPHFQWGLENIKVIWKKIICKTYENEKELIEILRFLDNEIWFSNMSPCKNLPNQIDKLFMDKLGKKNNGIFKKMNWKCKAKVFDWFQCEYKARVVMICPI